MQFNSEIMKNNDKKTTLIKYGLCDYCICCGAQVPEGTMVCPNCESQPTLKPINDKSLANK